MKRMCLGTFSRRGAVALATIYPCAELRILKAERFLYVWKRSFLYDEKKQPHREGFVPDTAVLISVYYVRSDSAAPAQIMATPAFDCGACSDT